MTTTCDHCQKLTHTEQTDYGRVCESCFNQAEYDER